MIEDKRLFEIIRGVVPTDSEIAEIVRSAVKHCCRREEEDLSLSPITIRQGNQGSTWFEAFKALFKDMPNDLPYSAKDYENFLVYREDVYGSSFVGFAYDINDGNGLQIDSADREYEEEFIEHPEKFTLIPIVGLDWKNACSAENIINEEE